MKINMSTSGQAKRKLLGLIVLITFSFPFNSWTQTNSDPNENLRMIYSTMDSGTKLLMVYSTSTGDFECFYLDNEKWLPNPMMPKPDISIAKENLRMIYSTMASGTKLLMVYSTSTGDFECFYLENKQWLPNPMMPKPNITIKE